MAVDPTSRYRRWSSSDPTQHRFSVFDRFQKYAESQRQYGYRNIYDMFERLPRAWFRSKIRDLGGTEVMPAQVLRDKARTKTVLYPGRMYFYNYDPKWKRELKYYDNYPLILPIEMYENGWLGINIHYLPMNLRIVILSKLYDFATDQRMNERTRIAVSYSLLKGAAKYAEVIPCLKRYLKSHVRSHFIRINVEEMPIAAFLPIARFRKKSMKTVHSDSVKRIHRGW